MKGYYLYGICGMRKAVCESLNEKAHANCECAHANNLKGIDGAERPLGAGGVGGGEVILFPYKNIAAIVEEVSLEKFGSEEIERKAKEDLEWIKDKALLHEKVLEAAMNKISGPIVPMKFGIILNNKKKLADSLKKNYPRFKKLLMKLGGREEWSLKIYLISRLFENMIKRTSPVIQKRLERLKSLSAGQSYFLEKELDEVVEVEAKKSLNNHLLFFLRRLGQFAEEVKENKILGKELTQRNEPMVFNEAFLIEKERVDDFLKEVQKLQAEFEELGFIFEPSGPWPPYNFV